MMTKQKSNERAFIKKIMLVPLLALLVFVMACSKEEKLFISSNVDTRAEFLNNMKNAWWYPILKKHNIEPHAYNTFDNVFEMGTTNSIDNEIVTLENAFFLIGKDSTEYVIIKSPLAYHNLDSNYIECQEGNMEVYKAKSEDKRGVEKYVFKTMKYNLNGSAYKASDVKGVVYKRK